MELKQHLHAMQTTDEGVPQEFVEKATRCAQLLHYIEQDAQRYGLVEE
jgi:hypothetical protein